MPSGIYLRTVEHRENTGNAMRGKHWKCKNGFENRSKVKLGNTNTLGKHWKRKYLMGIKEKEMRSKKRNKYFKKQKELTGEFVSEKTKKKMSISHIKYLEIHKGKFKNTNIERIMKKFLNFLVYLKVIKEFKYQFRIGRYLVDFYIPEWNLIIECYGTYWHKRFARKYRDMKRKKVLERKGYKILIFWDYELLKFKNLLKTL